MRYPFDNRGHQSALSASARGASRSLPLVDWDLLPAQDPGALRGPAAPGSQGAKPHQHGCPGRHPGHGGEGELLDACGPASPPRLCPPRPSPPAPRGRSVHLLSVSMGRSTSRQSVAAALPTGGAGDAKRASTSHPRPQSEFYEVTLPKPLGVKFARGRDGGVYISSILKKGSLSDEFEVGDKVRLSRGESADATREADAEDSRDAAVRLRPRRWSRCRRRSAAMFGMLSTTGRSSTPSGRATGRCT